mgnify:CR=1 FL=1
MDILEGELELLTGFDKEMREHALPIWFESLIGIDWTLLHLAPVYYGFGVPKGDGSPVIVVPGAIALKTVRKEYRQVEFPERWQYPSDLDTMLDRDVWEEES